MKLIYIFCFFFINSKKIKKSLGPDFLDPSGVKYQLLKSSYENKCEICFKNSDKTMVDCKKCKFKGTFFLNLNTF